MQAESQPLVCTVNVSLLNIIENELKNYFLPLFSEAVFDLTRETFGKIFAEDLNTSQPVWMKPCRMTSTYLYRIKDPSDLEEVKVCLKLLT